MFSSLELEREGEVREFDEKRYQRAYETLRDSQLPDYASPQEFSKRINTSTVHINPLCGMSDPSCHFWCLYACNA